MYVRTILLKKIVSIKANNLDFPPAELKPERCWIAQGRFDFIWACERQKCNGNVFRYIKTYNEILSWNSCPDAYYHPIYLLSDLDDSEFWNAEMWFMAIARVHFSTSNPQYAQHNKVTQWIQEFFKDCDCKIQVYTTVELSDLILAVKSNSITSLLYRVLNLRKNADIGRVYTYCGIDCKLLFSPNQIPEIKIPFCSMRFAVHNAKNVSNAIKLIEDKMGERTFYAVIGVDDIIVNWEPIYVDRLAALYWFLYQEATDDELKLFESFSSITTRLGTTPSFEDLNENSNRPERLTFACDKLVEIVKQIRNQISQKEAYLGIYSINAWLNALSELTVILSRLSRTSVLDEFAYLMLPAVEAFLLNVQASLYSKDHYEFMDLCLEHCRLFVDSWALLMEHVMRIEGQLTQLPQLRPPLHNISLTMLEYMLAFSNQCVIALQGIEDTKVSQDIRFLIIPRFCDEIEAVELFRARVSNNIDLPGLVLISIPPHMMYSSGEVQLALCHEISHFVGEKYRFRDFRISRYADAVGSLLEASVFQTNAQEFEAACVKWAQILLQPSQGASLRYMKELESKVLLTLGNVFCLENGPEEYSNLIRKLLLLVAEQPIEHNFNIPTDFSLLCIAFNQAFAQQLEIITNLFREILADIFMLLLLEPSPEVYLQSIAADLHSSQGGAYEPAANRIYICLSALDKPIPKCTNIMSSDGAELQKLDIVIQCLKDKSAHYGAKFHADFDIMCGIPPACTEAILKYARKCAEGLDSALQTSSAKAELLRMFQKTHSSHTDIGEMQKYICTHRMLYFEGITNTFTN